MSQIKIEITDKPTLIRFKTDQTLTKDPQKFKNIEEADGSPLAKKLFKLPFIKSVAINSYDITLERFDMVQWSEVQSELKNFLEDYLLQKKPLFSDPDNFLIEVYAESTPNPDTRKFVTNKFLTNQSIEIKDLDEAAKVPLAYELFEYPFVKKVFISQNYISITKDKTLEWIEVNDAIRDFLKEYLQTKKNVISSSYASGSTGINPDETSKQIVSLINEYIKPAVNGDGGNIKFESYDPETKIVNVTLQGACNGCPSSTITLKHGIEATLKRFLGDKIESVESLN
ncbi:MAG: NifU family protein [Flavobacteriia bacterium]|nr:MAG: NifU family protein [Flavobacteriia bacterium]